MRSRIFTLLLSAWMLFPCASGHSQTALPYYTGFDSATEQEGWTEYRVGATVSLNQWSYSNIGAFSDPQCLMHGYPVGGTELTDDWFVSPEFDFSAGGMIDSLRYEFSGFGTPGSNDTIGVYLLNGSPDPALASDVVMLYNFTDSTYINDNTWRKTEPFEIPAADGQSYIAFRYSTVVNWLDVKFDNLSISGAPLGSSTIFSASSVEVYPNPSHDFINVKIDENLSVASLQLMDLQGKVVRSFEINQDKLNVAGLAAGHYILQITSNNRSLSKKIVVQ